jgi:hypothetical protein
VGAGPIGSHTPGFGGGGFGSSLLPSSAVEDATVRRTAATMATRRRG